MIDSRLSQEGMQVRRRRICQQCQSRFTTYEIAQLPLPKILKSDGSKQTYSPSKVLAGINRALEKRPVKPEEIDQALARIQHKLALCDQKEVPSRMVGDLVMEELKRLDQVAYVRFASVYLSFEDVGAFRDEIEMLESQPGPEIRRRQMNLLDDDH